MNSKILAVTGHRPPAIGGYNNRNPKRLWVKNSLYQVINKIRLEYLDEGFTLEMNCGMAQGVELDSAEVALSLNMPVHMKIVKSLEYQSSKWPKDSSTRWINVVQRVLASGGSLDESFESFHERNKGVVEGADVGLSVINSFVRSGGTFYTTELLKSKGVLTSIISPDNETIRYLK